MALKSWEFMGQDTTDAELSGERFGFTVFLSACMHAMIILGVGFTYLGEINSEAALEVTIAQYRSELAPDDTDFLAQENQVGSGATDAATAPGTPFESEFNADTIQDARPLPRAPEVAGNVAVQDIAVISTVQDATQVTQRLQEVESRQEQSVTNEMTADEISLAITSLRAQLDLRRQEYAKRPRRYTISSASTRKSHDALYLDNWRRRIEAVGNINYPEEARRRQIYGSLRMLVAVRPDGELEEIQILQTSGHSILDRAAIEIVNLAAPFRSFPDELRAEADILEIIRTWRFHEGNALTSF